MTGMETFYDVIFVAMITKSVLKHQKSVFKYISKTNSVTYTFFKLFFFFLSMHYSSLPVQI